MRDWKVWTKEEDAILREIWKKPGSLKSHMSKFPGRTVHAVRYRGNQFLGLPARRSLRATNYSWVRQAVEEAFTNGFSGTKFELAEKTGTSHQRVGHFIREGHGTKYHISEWKRRDNGGDWKAVWSAGVKKDAPKPRRLTGAEVSRTYRKRLKVREGRINPFATAISNVTGVEKIAPTGQYKSRVYKEAA